MGRPRKHPHPEIGTRYGNVTVTGALFEAQGGLAEGKPYKTWFVPCMCGLCGGHFSCMWNNLRRGLVSRCEACKREADGQRFIDNAKVFADARRKDEYRWYDGTPYVYAIAYEEARVLKIGYSRLPPATVVSRVRINFRRRSTAEATGKLFWYGMPASLADEVMLQALFTKRYGSAFENTNRLCEWVKYDSKERAFSLLKAAFEFSQANFPG